MPRKINVVYCPGSSFATLTAPAGFNYNWLSSGQTTQTITVPFTGVSSVVYKCAITSQFNSACSDTIEATLVPITVISDFTFTNACQGVPITFNHNSFSRLWVQQFCFSI